jgi:TusA-related sulfurtransferase
MAFAFEERTHDLVREYSVVLDGTDLFESKLAISDACVDRGVRYVFAGVVAHEGQVMAVEPGRSACLRCLFDEAPPAGGAPTCAEIGVTGPVAGIVGAHQAKAALALLSGDAGVLDRIWVYDGKRDQARFVPLRRAPDCKGCGTHRDRRRASAVWDGPIDDAASQGAPLVDLSGLVCPATYVETRKALARLPEHGRVWIVLTSDEAARNIPRSAIAAGHRVLRTQSDGRTHRLLLERGDEERL